MRLSPRSRQLSQPSRFPMPKLPILAAKEVLKILRENGFEVVGRKGSHIRLKRKSRLQPGLSSFRTFTRSLAELFLR
ncbi:MAG: type II toxin-antitoxin system HicA family toxin [Thermoplasmata archaeon]